MSNNYRVFLFIFELLGASLNFAAATRPSQKFVFQIVNGMACLWCAIAANHNWAIISSWTDVVK